MTIPEKLALIEKVLNVKPGSLTVETDLHHVPSWDSLTILNLQVELTAIAPDLQFDNLYNCMSVGEICDIIAV